MGSAPGPDITRSEYRSGCRGSWPGGWGAETCPGASGFIPRSSLRSHAETGEDTGCIRTILPGESGWPVGQPGAQARQARASDWLGTRWGANRSPANTQKPMESLSSFSSNSLFHLYYEFLFFKCTFHWSIVDKQSYTVPSPQHGGSPVTHIIDPHPSGAVTVCQHRKMLHNHWLYSLSSSIPMTNSHYDWDFVPFYTLVSLLNF